MFGDTVRGKILAVTSPSKVKRRSCLPHFRPIRFSLVDNPALIERGE